MTQHKSFNFESNDPIWLLKCGERPRDEDLVTLFQKRPLGMDFLSAMQNYLFIQDAKLIPHTLQAFKIAEQTLKKTLQKQNANTYLEEANHHFHLNHIPSALDNSFILYKNALRIAEAKNDKSGICKAVIGIGMCLQNNHSYLMAQALYKKAYETSPSTFNQYVDYQNSLRKENFLSNIKQAIVIRETNIHLSEKQKLEIAKNDLITQLQKYQSRKKNQKNSIFTLFKLTHSNQQKNKAISELLLIIEKPRWINDQYKNCLLQGTSRKIIANWLEKYKDINQAYHLLPANLLSEIKLPKGRPVAIVANKNSKLR